MNKAEEKLCIDIAFCQNTGNTPCTKVSGAAKCPHALMPEPWSGHLSEAKILFIGSNPSFDCNELYPDSTWSKQKICDFFENRFKNGKVLKSAGKRDKVKYWSELITYTNMINDLESNRYYIGRLAEATKTNGWNYSVLDPYVASTEIVHCKSKNLKILSKRCLSFCFNKWMPKILSFFTGDVIVLIGKETHSFEPQIKSLLNGRKITIVLAPYPR